jgi:hypothetical protein
MENLNELKKVWLSANTDSLPDAGTVRLMVKKYRDEKLFKKIAMVGASVVLAAMMLAIVFFYKSTMISTRAGEVLILIDYLILIINNTRSVFRLRRLKDCANKEFLVHMEQAIHGRIYFYKHIQIWCFLLGSIGLLLYLFEPLHTDISLLVICDTVMVVFLLLMWLLIRPRAFKRQIQKLNAAVKQIETLSNQL